MSTGQHRGESLIYQYKRLSDSETIAIYTNFSLFCLLGIQFFGCAQKLSPEPSKDYDVFLLSPCIIRLFSCGHCLHSFNVSKDANLCLMFVEMRFAVVNLIHIVIDFVYGCGRTPWVHYSVNTVFVSFFII